MTGKAMTALRKWGLTVDRVKEADQSVIDTLISNVTWHEKKSWLVTMSQK
jgi:endonuclease III